MERIDAHRRTRLAGAPLMPLLLPLLAAACMTTAPASSGRTDLPDPMAPAVWPVASAAPPLCVVGVPGRRVAVHASFERARASACTQTNDGALEVLIRPETIPVNDSAWYAFRLEAEAPRDLALVLRYEGGTHRYPPKTSRDGRTFTPFAPARVRVTADEQEARLSLSLEAGLTTLAAQPFETGAEALAHWDGAVASGQLVRRVFGASVRGVPLVALATPEPAPPVTLVLMARQHPPETTGAAAFDAFLARLLEDEPLARAFRQRVALLVLPVLNPDGLAAGHWRTNANGIDLNRDWGIGSQPETRAAASLIEAAHAVRPLMGLIDFHSTKRDLIYAMPAQDPLHPAGLAEDWFARWAVAAVAAGVAMPPIERTFDDDQMNSKTWARLRFGLSAVTYEVGDNTPVPTAQANARLAAQTYMQTVLARLPAPGGGA
jgi:cytosolic carboxypeptidase protein 6